MLWEKSFLKTITMSSENKKESSKSIVVSWLYDEQDILKQLTFNPSFSDMMVRKLIKGVEKDDFTEAIVFYNSECKRLKRTLIEYSRKNKK